MEKELKIEIAEEQKEELEKYGSYTGYYAIDGEVNEEIKVIITLTK